LSKNKTYESLSDLLGLPKYFYEDFLCCLSPEEVKGNHKQFEVSFLTSIRLYNSLINFKQNYFDESEV
jgi:hypothetical protein